MMRAYYIEEFADEIIPCNPTLEGWAEWLSKAAPEWGRDEPAKDESRHRAAVLRFDSDIIATCTGGEWTFSREPQATDFMAVRWGPELGWDADDILDGTVDALKQHLSSIASWADQPLHIAIGHSEPAVMLVYHASPLRMIVEAIQ